jgi:glutathione S-transferase
MSIEGKCRFGKLQLLVQLNRDYLSKKPLFFRRQEDENFKEKNPFGQVPLETNFERKYLKE